jgi:two-component system, sensor histidine kinase ChiS
MAVLTLVLSLVFSYTCLAEITPPFGVNPNFSHLMTENKQSIGDVQVITQDKKGFIWVGGNNGLARYDGYRFHIYTNDPNNPNSLSGNYVHDIFEDSLGDLWIATYGGDVSRLNRELDNFFVYRWPKGPKGPRIGYVEKIFEDSHKKLWLVGHDGLGYFDRQKNQIGVQLESTLVGGRLLNGMIQLTDTAYLITSFTGLLYWDSLTNTQEFFSADDNKPGALNSNTLKDILKDSYGNIWVAHDLGISRFDPVKKTFDNIAIKSIVPGKDGVPIWRIFEDSKKMMWLCSDGNGLMYFDPRTREMGHYTQTTSPTSLSSNVVRAVIEDEVGDFWAGNFPSGINHFNNTNNFFKLHTNFLRDKNGIFKNQVWAFSEDKQNNLWLGVDGNGLVYYDRKTNSFSKNYEGVNLDNPEFPLAILSLLLDSKNVLWFGSWAQGVGRLDLTTKKYEILNPKTTNNKFIGRNIWNIMETKNGEIYFATMNEGIIRYNRTTDKYTNYRAQPGVPNTLHNNIVWSLHEAKDGMIWLGTNEGIEIFNPKTEKFHQYYHDPENPKSLSNNSPYSFLEDSKGRMWISLMGGGVNLFNPEDQSFSHIRKNDGIISDLVTGVLEDNNGDLWICTRAGITKYNPEKKTFQNFTTQNWLQNGEFSIGAFYKLSNGELAFGGANGFNIIDPHAVAQNTHTGPIFFTELEVFNKPVFAAAKDSPLKTDILESHEIIINHTQTLFSIVFSAINYRAYADNKYRVILEGYDQKWQEPTRVNRVTYANLPAGNYNLKVQASNNDGIWSPEQKTIAIVVLPAPWRTWWAYSIYTLLIMSLILWYVLDQRNKIRAAEIVNTKLTELNRLKDNFMANTSHELRTPINGIIGVTQALKDEASQYLPHSEIEKINIIVSCGHRLARLVDDILDFSAIKKSTVVLNNATVELKDLLSQIILESQSVNQNSQLVIENRLPENMPNVYGDQIKLAKIFYNLINNAIKFTETGSVIVTSSSNPTHITINIADTGVGIAEESLAKLFASFEQIADSGAYEKNGTGLGLAITKYLVELHGGSLSVESTLGKGSVFSVKLPLTNATNPENATAISQGAAPNNFLKKNLLPIEKNAQEQLAEKPSATASNELGLSVFYPKVTVGKPEHYRAKVLVVDDESVNRMVLRHMLLKHHCIVYEACNGQEMVDALEHGFHCDLILLDVMMPKLSGLDACKMVRKTHSSKKLPIIFVTAKSQDSDKAECFAVGGNDFLAKPVIKENLYSRVDALLVAH